MFDWLGNALDGAGHVVTANRRLARSIVAEYGAGQVALGKRAWTSPRVYSWGDWLTRLLAGAHAQPPLPLRINANQSRVLWERCLRREISDPLLNLDLLVRQAREAWSRLQEFGVSLEECRAAAIGRDQRLFAAAAASYASVLERENWIDDALSPALLTEQLSAGTILSPPNVTLAGFDQVSPQVERLLAALAGQGSSCRHVEAGGRCVGIVQAFDNPVAELRAAGRWARDALFERPGLRLAIVVPNLERDAQQSLRLVREGLSPGWQWAGSGHENAVSVSYGRPLSAFPACEIALLLLRWLAGELSGAELGLLLRSPMLGSGEFGGRSRLELYLRGLPDRRRTPDMALSELSGRPEAGDARDWLSRLSTFTECRSGLPRRISPAAWGEVFDKALSIFGWPGQAPLGSAEFQLVNRWRELLNELARLELVSDDLGVGDAVRRIAAMAGETVFQPEAEGGLVQVLGPLEAAGMEFDRLWISGLGSAEWPPQGRPSALLGRDLQRLHGMPDADPANTLDYSRRVLSRLLGSAGECVCSYARSLDDIVQTLTPLLADCGFTAVAGQPDPGWHAAAIGMAANTAVVTEDPVPELGRGESVAGGAAVLRWQMEEPFSAFAFGRLGISLLQPFTFGLRPSLRGSLIHAALCRLYQGIPSGAAIKELGPVGVQTRCEQAAAAAFSHAHKNADPVLSVLLRMEERRVVRLLTAVLRLDADRPPFTVSFVEKSLSTKIEEVPMRLRIDRIDTLDTGGVVILDYKTGTRRRFLGSDGRPGDIQLVVYACALGVEISDLALVNVDSRVVEISGAGKTLTPGIDWDAALADWAGEVRRAARELRAGDVRLYSLHSLQSSRPLSLLSRIREQQRDA